MLVAKALASGNVLIMGVRRIFPGGGKRPHFVYHFQVADDAMQMAVNKTLYLFYTTKKCPILRQQSQKLRFVGKHSNASFSLMLIFYHCIKLGCLSQALTALTVSLHYLPRCLRSTQSHVAKCLLT